MSIHLFPVMHLYAPLCITTVLFPGEEVTCVIRNVQTGCGTHSVSYLVASESVLPGEADGARSYDKCPYSADVARISEGVPALLRLVSWGGACLTTGKT